MYLSIILAPCMAHLSSTQFIRPIFQWVTFTRHARTLDFLEISFVQQGWWINSKLLLVLLDFRSQEKASKFEFIFRWPISKYPSQYWLHFSVTRDKKLSLLLFVRVILTCDLFWTDFRTYGMLTLGVFVSVMYFSLVRSE